MLGLLTSHQAHFQLPILKTICFQGEFYLCHKDFSQNLPSYIVFHLYLPLPVISLVEKNLNISKSIWVKGSLRSHPKALQKGLAYLPQGIKFPESSWRSKKELSTSHLSLLPFPGPLPSCHCSPSVHTQLLSHSTWPSSRFRLKERSMVLTQQLTWTAAMVQSNSISVSKQKGLRYREKGQEATTGPSVLSLLEESAPPARAQVQGLKGLPLSFF